MGVFIYTEHLLSIQGKIRVRTVLLSNSLIFLQIGVKKSNNLLGINIMKIKFFICAISMENNEKS